jgi:galactitol-1-phosphate 5-dehydrogenase
VLLTWRRARNFVAEKAAAITESQTHLNFWGAFAPFTFLETLMKSVVIHAEGDVRVEERPIPQLQTDEDVLVKWSVQDFAARTFPVSSIMVRTIIQSRLGMSSVVMLNPTAQALPTYNPAMPLPACRCFPASTALSASAATRYVKQYQFVGSRSEGATQNMVVKRANLFRLPSDMPIDDGAFIEPITVGLHASSGAGLRRQKRDYRWCGYYRFTGACNVPANSVQKVHGD